MNAQPSREQLSIAIGALSSESIRAKLQDHELTALARAVAEEELARRENEGEPETPPMVAALEDSPWFSSDLLQRPLGWSWGRWLAVTAVCVLIVASLGATARNKSDQSFLYGVILIQGIVVAGIVRAMTAVLNASSALGVLGRVAAIGVLAFVLLGLTLCSSLAQHGWGGG
jgi:hypothetical protein